MKNSIGSFRLIAVAITAALATAAILAGVTIASDNGSNEATTSALSKKQQIKLIKKYAKKYAKTGPTGAAGAPGSAGVVAAYSASLGSSVDIEGGNTTVLAKSIPAGKFAVNAKVRAQGLDPIPGTAAQNFAPKCTLLNGATVVDTAQASATTENVAFLIGWYGDVTMPLQAVVDNAAADTLTIKCDGSFNGGSGDFTLEADFAKIAAVEVASIG